jgi:hypothetical protein
MRLEYAHRQKEKPPDVRHPAEVPSVLGNAAIIGLSVISVNSVHGEKRAAGWTFIRR